MKLLYILIILVVISSDYNRQFTSLEINKIISTDFHDTNFSDLKVLDECIKNKTIVIISVNRHSDKTAYDLNKRLVLYLINKHGFNQVFFEQPFFPNGLCKNVNDNNFYPDFFHKGEWYREIVFDYVDFYNFIKHTCQNNIDINGIDAFCDTNFFSDIHKRICSINSNLTEFEKKYSKGYEALIKSEKIEIDLLIKEGNLLINTINHNKVSDSQLINATIRNSISGLVWANYFNNSSKYKIAKPGFTNFRDSVMFQNVLFYLKQRGIKSKSIILVSSYHALKNLQSIKSRVGIRNVKVKPLGQYIYDSFGNNCYSIANIEYSGYANCKSNIILPGKNKNSIEYFLHKNNTKLAFVDISKFKYRFVMSPTFDKSNILAEWCNVYDGLLYIDEMEYSGWKLYE